MCREHASACLGPLSPKPGHSVRCKVSWNCKSHLPPPLHAYEVIPRIKALAAPVSRTSGRGLSVWDSHRQSHLSGRGLSCRAQNHQVSVRGRVWGAEGPPRRRDETAPLEEGGSARPPAQGLLWGRI